MYVVFCSLNRLIIHKCFLPHIILFEAVALAAVVQVMLAGALLPNYTPIFIREFVVP